MTNYKKLEWMHFALQEVINQANSMGDHNIDIPMIEQCLAFIEDIRDPYFELKKDGYSYLKDEEVSDD